MARSASDFKGLGAHLRPRLRIDGHCAHTAQRSLQARRMVEWKIERLLLRSAFEETWAVVGLEK